MANENGLLIWLEFVVKDIGHAKTYNKISILEFSNNNNTCRVEWHVLETCNNLGFCLNQSKIFLVRYFFSKNPNSQIMGFMNLFRFLPIFHIIVSSIKNLCKRTLSIPCRRFSERVSNSIPQSEELTVVVVVEEVVISVMRWAVDIRFQSLWYPVISIMNRDGPKVNKHKQEEVGEFVKGEYEGVNVVGAALQESVDRVESVAGKWCWYFPSAKQMNVSINSWNNCTAT